MNPISSITSGFAPSALDSGRNALDRSNQQLNRDARLVADPSRKDLAAPMVDSKRALQLTKAGAAVIKTADEMIGTLLDTIA